MKLKGAEMCGPPEPDLFRLRNSHKGVLPLDYNIANGGI